MNTFIKVICFSFINFLIFLSFALFGVSYLRFILEDCYMSVFGLWFHLISFLNLLRFIFVFVSFLTVIIVSFSKFKIFKLLLTLLIYHAKLFITFFSVSWLRHLDFVYKLLVISIFLQLPSKVDFSILQAYSFSYKSQLFIVQISSSLLTVLA